MSEPSIRTVRHECLTPADLTDLRRLFDGEYLAEFGDWNPDQPYGYASHEVHVVARSGADIVGHVGWARRTISVGAVGVEIAGVGGVLVSKAARDAGLGAQLMAVARLTMLEAGGIEFGYLGCREGVVPFYRSCGWQRISAGERSVSREGRVVEEARGQPLLIVPVTSSLPDWPGGMVDLRGRAW